LYVEAQFAGLLVDGFFVGGEQVDQQGCQMCFLQDPRDELVAAAEAAAAAAVGEEDRAEGVVGDGEFSFQQDAISGNFNGIDAGGVDCRSHCSPHVLLRRNESALIREIASDDWGDWAKERLAWDGLEWLTLP
jgi:hypothetical protein